MSTNHQRIAILDFGGPEGRIIARRIRAQKVYCEVLNRTTPVETLKGYHGLVCTGKELTPEVSDRQHEVGLPLLSCKDPSQVSDNQLHDFLYDVCKLDGDWTTQAAVADAVAAIKAQVGDRKVLCGLSGGVDSSVTALMVHKAIGSNLTCVFVDTGLMRKNEGDEVQAAFAPYDMQFIRVDAQQRFLSKLDGVTDPEQKRKIIGEEFIRVFEDEASKLGPIDFMAQGTIYPDIIESGIGGAAVKSHHNVGGMPANIGFAGIVEPLKELFKDEVRQAGMVLGLDEKLVSRQPFPGPGLGVRVVGAITEAKLSILREADAIFRETLEAEGCRHLADQYFAAILDIRSVGVTNEARTYAYPIALRAVQTTDFMTARWSPIPLEVLAKASHKISQLDGVNRVLYDITDKPPATIEWE